MAERRKFNWGAIAEEMGNAEKKNFGNQKENDNRLYRPKIKDDGTFEGIIRFVPSPDTDLPFVIVYDHAFQGPDGSWFIEKCPKTHNEDCPVCKHASKVWNSGDEEAARRRFKKMTVYSNILVIKDPQTPENEGKVFLFKYGKKMYEQIKNTMIPPKDSIDEPVMVFDYDEGANFKLKIATKIINGWNGKKTPVPNYDASQFMSVSKLPDHVVDTVESSIFPLKPFASRDKFLSNDELIAKLNKVEGLTAGPVASKPAEKDPLFQFDDEVQTEKKPEKKVEKKETKPSDDDDFFAQFK